jgi:hypothetical protein
MSLWVVAASVILVLIFAIGTMTLKIDDVASCKFNQWLAGGKKLPEMDIISNVNFLIDEKGISADFRSLQKVWSQICLTSLYEPGAAYFGKNETHRHSSVSPRTMGCWRGSNPSYLTVVLANVHTGESEDYQIPVPSKLRNQEFGHVISTDYRIADLREDARQCSETRVAVARCHRDDNAATDRCLLVFSNERNPQ